MLTTSRRHADSHSIANRSRLRDRRIAAGCLALAENKALRSPSPRLSRVGRHTYSACRTHQWPFTQALPTPSLAFETGWLSSVFHRCFILGDDPCMPNAGSGLPPQPNESLSKSIPRPRSLSFTGGTVCHVRRGASRAVPSRNIDRRWLRHVGGGGHRHAHRSGRWRCIVTESRRLPTIPNSSTHN